MTDLVELRLESLAYGGDAVAHTPEGEVAFVRGGCPGDLVRARVLARKPRFLQAEVTHVVEPSADRVEPPCPYFGRCGGCQWQHVSYEAQLAAKRRAVADALERIGGQDPALVAETEAGPAELGYRNKVELHVAMEGGLRLGYVALGSEEHVPVEECLLLAGAWRGAPRALTGALRFAGRGGDLGISRVALRASTITGDAEIALWAAPGAFPRAAVARTLRDALPLTGVTRVLVKGDAKERRVKKVEVLAGHGAWREHLGGRDLLVSSPSFFQVNTAAAEELVTLVARVADGRGTDRVLDCYAGVGTFTLALSPAAGEVVAVESSSFALRDLRRNLERSEVDAHVEPGDASHVLEGLGRFDVAVVDPPRAGLDARTVKALAESGPARVVYVSCDPGTLARDAKRLAGAGYRIVSATPVDLFPQTYHVETVAVLERG